MRVLAPVVAAVLALGGCAAPADPCAMASPETVHAVHGTDIHIQQGDLILHAAMADIYRSDASGCHAIAAADVQEGDALGHDATAIAESYPMQAWPDTVVVRQAR